MNTMSPLIKWQGIGESSLKLVLVLFSILEAEIKEFLVYYFEPCIVGKFYSKHNSLSARDTGFLLGSVFVHSLHRKCCHLHHSPKQTNFVDELLKFCYNKLQVVFNTFSHENKDLFLL